MSLLVPSPTVRALLCAALLKVWVVPQHMWDRLYLSSLVPKWAIYGCVRECCNFDEVEMQTYSGQFLVR